MDLFQELPLTAQTAYAQLLESAVSAEHFRSLADLPGSFAAKSVRGHKYWYFQYTEPSGKLRQAYVGPDGDAVRALMARKNEPSPIAALGPMARAAAALGCTEVLPKHLRVIARLGDYGFFRAGGVLVGTHAFLAYGNMLGIRWGDASRTQVVDFAHAGRNLAVALPGDFQLDTHAAIESLGMGLLPVAGIASPAGVTYLNPREPEFRLDFLTTLYRGGTEPYRLPQLGITLQPLKFMEFSLENVQLAVLISGDKCVLASVPHPARYALHKLIVYGERIGTFATKSGKDIAQAAALLARLRDTWKWEVDEAWSDLMNRGAGWRQRAIRGRDALAKAYPDVAVAEWLAT
jgi:hypothetical protein